MESGNFETLTGNNQRADADSTPERHNDLVHPLYGARRFRSNTACRSWAVMVFGSYLEGAAKGDQGILVWEAAGPRRRQPRILQPAKSDVRG